MRVITEGQQTCIVNIIKAGCTPTNNDESGLRALSDEAGSGQPSERIIEPIITERYRDWTNRRQSGGR